MRVPRRLALLALAGGSALYVRKIHRYRDPVRLGEAGPGELLCPADGRVSFVRHIDQGHAEALDWPISELFQGDVPREGWLVGILLSPLDVHYTYAPVSGKVTSTRSMPGGRHSLGGQHLLQLAAQQPVDLLGSRGTRDNERHVYTQDTPGGAVHVVAVGSRAGLQGTTYLKVGDDVRAGHKALFLPEGGLVITYFPLSARPQVSVGERVVGARTVMARTG